MSDVRHSARGATRGVSGVVAVVSWWALLGWDTQRYRGSDGDLHGPYSTAQVSLFVLTLIAVAAWTGLRRDVLLSSGVVAGVTALDFAISAQLTPSVGASLWPVGAVLIGAAVFGGRVTVGFATEGVATRFVR